MDSILALIKYAYSELFNWLVAKINEAHSTTEGSAYEAQTGLFNCTRVGAHLKRWKHLPLDQHHPVVKASITGGSRRSDIETREGQEQESRISCKIKNDVQTAIESEIAHQVDVESLTSSLVEELRRILTSQDRNTSTLEALEKELAMEMATRGWLTNFYTLPAKLDVDATLSTVENLEENLMVSLDYYLAIKGSAQHLMALLRKAQSHMAAS